RVFERDDLLRLEGRVCAVDVRDLDLAGQQRLKRRVTRGRDGEVDTVELLRARRTVRTPFELGCRTDRDLLADVRKVSDRGEAVRGGEFLRHRVGVLVAGLGVVKCCQTLWQHVLECRVDSVRAVRVCRAVVELQQVAGVLREQVDRAGFEFGNVRVTL